MKRLGKFTGKIYDEDYDFSKCPECCLLISEEKAKDENFLKEAKFANYISCAKCFECPASRSHQKEFENVSI